MSNRLFASFADNNEDERPTLTRRVYESLRDEITTGTLPPGTRLVRRTLSKRMGVSPLPVAEALSLLEQDGLVESAPLCGARVKPLTVQTLIDELNLREALECHLARVVAERATDSQLAGLFPLARRVDQLMQRSDSSPTIGRQLHMDFHLRVARLSGLKLMEQELRRAWLRKMMQLTWLSATHLRRVPDGWHEQFLDALATHDPDRAEQCARRHVRCGRDEIIQSLQRNDDDKENQERHNP